jgi:hypothetical protein
MKDWASIRARAGETRERDEEFHYLSFRMYDSFFDNWRDRNPDWGFPIGGGNTLGEYAWITKYSRLKADGTKERFWEGLRRVIEGTYSIQKDHALRNRLPWNEYTAHRSAQEAYTRAFAGKWSPPGRGFWMMGTEFVNGQNDSSALQNCSFLSTAHIAEDPSKASVPFSTLMNMSMLGIGVGFDTAGAGKVEIHEPREGSSTFTIDDSREGWCRSVDRLLTAYFSPNKSQPSFDYSNIRKAGSPIRGFGGTSAGPKPLRKLHSQLQRLLRDRDGDMLTSTDIVDIMNMIGKCVIAANVRSSAEIALGEADDEAFLDLKDYRVNPERMGADGWGYTSNNSVIGRTGQDYSHLAERMALNGEPGILWLDVVRNHGRLVDGINTKDHRAAGCNPCGEQPLEHNELCVTGATLLHTSEGVTPIAELVDTETEIWNGTEWSKVTPFFAGNIDTYRVVLSDGSYLDATPGHEWLAKRKTERTFKAVKTTDLVPGMVLPEFRLSACDGKPVNDAYELGWFTGDGFIDGARSLGVVQEDEYPVIDSMNCIPYKEQHPPGYTRPFKRVHFPSIPSGLGSKLRDHYTGLPSEVLSMDSGSIAEFIAGWIDTDGSVIHNPNTDHYVLYGSEDKLRDAQILLRRIGVNHATLRMFADKGSKTNYGTRNYSLWRLLIPSYESSVVPTRIKIAHKFGSRYAVNNRHPDGIFIDRARKQKIVRIEKMGTEKVYCLNEPNQHQCVFGNVLTRQCTLVETYPTRCEDLDDYLRTLKFAYLYGKTVTLLMTKWPETNEVMIRNRRIGTSMTGIAQFAERHGWAELRKWQDEGYREIRRWDEIYSEWLGVRESIRVTTVKPSGTVSLLFGVTPGCHWPKESGHYIRTVRENVNSPIVNMMKDAGYRVEPSVSNPDTTMVISLPTEGPKMRSESEVTIWEKASLAAQCQRYWSDNSVSVTLTFDVEKESDQIAPVLGAFDGQLKSVSFLPMTDGVYAQAPYQKVSLDRWTFMTAGLGRLDWDSLYDGAGGQDAEGELYCSTDSCEIRAKE